MSGDKTKAVVPAAALGLLVLGFGCYFVFAGDSEAKAPSDVEEVAVVTPAPPVEPPPRVQEERKPQPRQAVAGPRIPDRTHENAGHGRQPKPPRNEEKEGENHPALLSPGQDVIQRRDLIGRPELRGL